MQSMEFILNGGVAAEQVRLPVYTALNVPSVELNFLFDLQLIFFLS